MTTRRAHHPPPALVVEVQAPYACFTRPEFKTERLSYPVMTPSAAKGVLEAIFWKPEFFFQIEKIEVLRPIRWSSIRRNEVSSMLSLSWVRDAMSDPTLRFDAEADRDQRNMVCLRDVAYRIHAQIRLRPHATDPEAKYRDQFRRRVERGACYSQPFLGVREFSASFHPATPRPPIPHDEQLGVMLHSISYGDKGESYRWFDAVLDNGVLIVPRHGVELPTGQAASRSSRTGGRS
ncbi:type I-C CRISPR-associated protein Cas5c [Sphaerisporangium rhizosphaerae]|uniref:pre-crRNA processing endonuclease n=1 Tax=Sphaerisporangium rhizosphaerae TaxID=2269375 RepID=A0ABW2NYF6_9ACTN